MMVFDEVGGQPFFDQLVHRFYERVALDPVLRPLYPEDLEPGERHLALFLGQYWGGPTTYSDERGHPRLRMRHAPFVVDLAARDAWYDAMAASVAEAGVGPEHQQQLLAYFATAADHMVNE
ncbi:MAG: glbO [Actinomycetia bacterium]|nr:glbO [Actinomycetes bacterium]